VLSGFVASILLGDKKEQENSDVREVLERLKAIEQKLEAREEGARFNQIGK
jgi:hypothetical protein